MRWRWLQTFDWSLYIIPLLLLTTGVATIYTVTFISRGNQLAMAQVIYAVIGLALMVMLTFADYRLWRGLIIPIYLFGIGALVLLIKPFSGLPFVISAYGASRWIDLGFFQFQPSEFFKLVLIITLAGFLANKRDGLRWWQIGEAIILTMIPVFLTLQQPDLGTASVLVIILAAMLTVAGLPKKYFLILGGLVLLLLPLSWFFLKDYQRARLEVFFNPQSDPLGAGYNVIQSMIAVGSGGLWGRGFGQGSQSQLNFLPVAHTDFIFAGLAEATGFAGALVLVVLFMVLFWRIIGIAKVAKDDFGMLVATGIGAMILFQVFVNIGMNLALAPVTGIPLPFVSSGGTTLIVSLMLMGILQSIYLRHKKITF